MINAKASDTTINSSRKLLSSRPGGLADFIIVGSLDKASEPSIRHLHHHRQGSRGSAFLRTLSATVGDTIRRPSVLVGASTWPACIMSSSAFSHGVNPHPHIAPAAFLEAAVFSPDGRFILIGEGWPFFTARLYDALSGEELRVFAGHAGPVDSVAFNADGTSILTGSDIVRLWSIAEIAARWKANASRTDLNCDGTPARFNTQPR